MSEPIICKAHRHAREARTFEESAKLRQAAESHLLAADEFAHATKLTHEPNVVAFLEAFAADHRLQANILDRRVQAQELRQDASQRHPLVQTISEQATPAPARSLYSHSTGLIMGAPGTKSLAESFFMVQAPESRRGKCTACQKQRTTVEALRHQLQRVNEDFAGVLLQLSKRNEEVARLKKSLRELRRALSEKLGANWHATAGDLVAAPLPTVAPSAATAEEENRHLRETIVALRQAITAKSARSASRSPAHEENQQLRAHLQELRASLHQDVGDVRDASVVLKENVLLQNSLSTITNNFPLLVDPESKSEPPPAAAPSPTSYLPTESNLRSDEEGQLSNMFSLKSSFADRSAIINELLTTKAPFE